MTRLYQHRLLIKLIDVQSPLGIYKSLRYRIRTYPTFIVEGKETYTGWDKASSRAFWISISRTLSHQNVEAFNLLFLRRAFKDHLMLS